MKSLHSRNRVLRIMAFAMPLLCIVPAAQAAQCRGTKVVQNCIQYHADGTWYATDVSVSPAYTTCTPIVVPCDYPDNIVDAISKLFNPGSD